jgi:hypothetical protein
VIPVSYGAYASRLDLEGKTVDQAYKIVGVLWNVPATATAKVNGHVVNWTYQIKAGDTLAFGANSRSRTVCAECDKPTFTEIDGYPLCHAHYQHTITHCTEHHWMLDSTQVFQERGRPVFLSFYFCTICSRAVIARSHETPEQAWVNRQRERLLRIQKLLTEEA